MPTKFIAHEKESKTNQRKKKEDGCSCYCFMNDIDKK